MPLVSIITPSWNVERFIEETIDSVQAQSFGDWELLIADDCSTDTAVQQLLSEYAASDERIKVIRREENGHISAASNSALSLVSGEWVALLDHDDILAPHALALFALAIADQPDAGVIYSDEDTVLESLGKTGFPARFFFSPVAVFETPFGAFRTRPGKILRNRRRGTGASRRTFSL